MDARVERGTLLAGRYRVTGPIDSDLPGASTWEATDQILERTVRAIILHEGDIAAALDAARRAALVSDPRLVRVLDVGQEGDLAYVVTEQVHGPSLAQIAARAPLPPDQARAVVGELSVALEAARRRGVHHLALRPSVVHIERSGNVVLTGLAVDAALLGLGLGDARSTTRADAIALVQVLYAALTGHWPGAPVAGATHDALPDAPLVDGVAVAPADLVPGVPNDLDTLCAVTFGPHEDGPHSPAELAAELEPWPTVRGAELADLRGASDRARDEREAAASTAATAAGLPAAPPSVQRQSIRSMFTEQPSAGSALPGTPPPAAPSRSTQSAGYATRQTSTFPPVTDAAGATGAAAGAAAVAGAAGAAGAHVGSEPPPSVPPPSVPLPSVPGPSGRPAAAASFPPRSASAGPVPPPGGGPFRPAAPPVSVPRGFPPTGAAVRPVFDDVVHHEEGLVERRFDPSKLVLSIVAVAVVIGVVLAYNALTAPVGLGTAASPRTSRSASAPASGSASASASPSPSSAAPTGEAPVIASGKSLDPPPGDNNEHPEEASKAIDGDPSTFWFSRTYRDPDYGMKQGIGYAITLKKSAIVSKVVLQVAGEGGYVEVRATDASTPTEGPVLAEGKLSASTELTFTAPAEAETIVLWFTKLPQNAEGKNRLELLEIQVS